MDVPGLDAEALGRAIVRRRTARGWTTYRLSQRAGMGDPYLRRLESGKGDRIGLDVLVRVAHALDTTVDALLADAGLPTAHGTVRELNSVYSHLNDRERRTWLRIGHVLREESERYDAGQVEEDEHAEGERGEIELDVLPDEPRAASQEPRDAGEPDQP